MRIMDFGDMVRYEGPYFRCEYPVLFIMDMPKSKSDRFITEVDCEYNGHIQTDCIGPSYIIHRMRTNFYTLYRFNPEDGIWTAGLFED